MKLLARILIAYLLLALPAASALAAAIGHAAHTDCGMHEGAAAGHEGAVPDCCEKAGMPAQKHDLGGQPCSCGAGFGCHAGTLLALPAPRVSLAYATLVDALALRPLLRPPLAIAARCWRPPASI